MEWINLSQTLVIRNYFMMSETYSIMHVRTEHKFLWHKITVFNENKLQMDGNFSWTLCQPHAILRIVGNNKYGEKVKIFYSILHIIYCSCTGFLLKMNIFQCHTRWFGGKVKFVSCWGCSKGAAWAIRGPLNPQAPLSKTAAHFSLWGLI